jgi:hypothetical protein
MKDYKAKKYAEMPKASAAIITADGLPVSAVKEASQLAWKLEALNNKHESLDGQVMPSGELWRAYDQAFKRILGGS